MPVPACRGGCWGGGAAGLSGLRPDALMAGAEVELSSGFESKMKRNRQSSARFKGLLGRLSSVSEAFNNALCAWIRDSPISRSIRSRGEASQRARRAIESASSAWGHMSFHFSLHRRPACVTTRYHSASSVSNQCEEFFRVTMPFSVSGDRGRLCSLSGRP